MFSEQGKRYWKFAECVAQCGTNSLKISESDYAVRPSIHFYKIAPGAPANAATLFVCPKGEQVQQARKEDLVGPEIPQRLRFVDLGK